MRDRDGETGFSNGMILTLALCLWILLMPWLVDATLGVIAQVLRR